MSEDKQKKGIGTGTGLVIGIAVIYILLGLAILMIPRFQTAYIIYAAGIILLVYGIILIVKYFMSASYLELGKYGFSGGVLCLIIGICMLIRAHTVAEYFPLFLGICILFTAVIKLQNAVALKSMEHGAWFVFLIVALAFLCASILIILDLFRMNAASPTYIYIILVGDGAINLAETLFLALAIRRKGKAAMRAQVPVEEPAGAEPELLESQKPEAELPEDILTPDFQDEGKETWL